MSHKTPLMKQYSEIKNDYTDALLLFRMGDFYETFYDDAKIVSAYLGITLTARHYKDETIPMAGFPVKSADMYISRLVSSGRKIAVCEQLEAPNKNIKLVKRGVVEVLTPGTLMRESLLNDKENNYIAACISSENHYIALSDITTGEFRVIKFDTKENLKDFLRKTKVSEILEKESSPITESSNVHLMNDFNYSFNDNERTVKRHFNITALDGIGLIDNESVIVAGVLLNYINENLKNSAVQITCIKFENNADYMYIDEQTLRNLEIFSRINGEQENSFLDIIDKTSTPMGARYLRYMLYHPYIETQKINSRLNEVEMLLNNSNIFRYLKNEIRSIGDIERIAIRIKTGKASYRDVILLEQALSRIPLIRNHLKNIKIESYNEKLNDLPDISKLINSALDKNKILNGKKERIIKSGYNNDYDNIIDISKNAVSRIREMENEEKTKTGISTLRISFNNIAGYYIEISNLKKDKVPPEYIWKQSLKNSTRYTTAELREYEEAVLHSDENLNKLENELFTKILERIAENFDELKDNAFAISSIDLSLSYGEMASQYNYIRPIVNEGKDIHIEKGRHPVVEAVEGRGKFIPNSLKTDLETQIILLTGPNMSGKSTYLRQNALIIYMTHLGMYVPAEYANIPLTDRIFTRIGASDDLSRGVSTFMAEMLESANIINNMTNRSFIILDEIGRGTSTFDGLSIAWAIVEYLHDCPEMPNILFATHYHELTELSLKLKRLKNYTTRVKRVKNRVIYLKRIIEGKSDDSYGLEVARMAGFPESIINNGYSILALLKENEENIREKIRDIEQLKLFNNSELKNNWKSEIIKSLNEIDINRTSPVEALLILETLKNKVEEK